MTYDIRDAASGLTITEYVFDVYRSLPGPMRIGLAGFNLCRIMNTL